METIIMVIMETVTEIISETMEIIMETTETMVVRSKLHQNHFLLYEIDVQA
jgi:hypothetical protein